MTIQMSEDDTQYLTRAAAYYVAKGTLTSERLRELAAERPDLPDLLLLAAEMDRLAGAS